MNRRLLILMAFLSMAPPASHAQQGGPSLFDPLSLRLSYFGEGLTHYGLSVGLEHPLTPDDGEHIEGAHLYSGVSLGLYRHPHNHYGLFVDAELGYRRVWGGGLKLGGSLGLGYLRTFVDGTTYRVTPDGSVETLALAGQHALMPVLALEAGDDRAFGGDESRLSWHVRPIVFLQIPYNTTILPHYALEIGTGYRLR